MKRLHYLFIAACLTSCSSSGPVVDDLPPQAVPKTNYGMFVGIGQAIEARMAVEAARQLWEISPPPSSLLDFQQRMANSDNFGRLLVKALHRNGYFVHQWFDPAVPPQCGQKPDNGKKSSGEYRRVPVCYLVDEVSGMLRLTLFVAGDTWSRLFNTEQDKLIPVGAWTQQNGGQGK